jgi:glycosyltransferase involved in cell wall biosynthesis
MNILFLTLIDFNTINQKGIYTDLLREFTKTNHSVYVVSPVERRNAEETKIIYEESCQILKLRIGNIQKTNLIEKGISTLTLESDFKKAIQNYFSDVRFDLVLYSTPPITIQKTIEYVKERDGAFTYLLLKDIFPQNAIDLGILRKNGWKGLIYRYFRNMESRLYKSSDFIGCMSERNLEYIVKNNDVEISKIEVCPNSIEVIYDNKKYDKDGIREKFNLPDKKVIYLYGGNLGKPQGVDFIIECLKANSRNEQVYFLIAGNGTEYRRLEVVLEKENIPNVKLMKALPKIEYDELVRACDVGLIFLDNRFTIPNFPSRLLSYMEVGLPVVAATDINTDLGEVITKGGFGLWSESGNVEKFSHNINVMTEYEMREKMGNKSRKYLEENYSSRSSYDIIMKHFID